MINPLLMISHSEDQSSKLLNTGAGGETRAGFVWFTGFVVATTAGCRRPAT